MPELIPVHLINFPEPVSAGMSLFELVSMARKYRNTNKHRKPILVTRAGDRYQLTDGRHRCVAAMIAGRKLILAEIDVS